MNKLLLIALSSSISAPLLGMEKLAVELAEAQKTTAAQAECIKTLKEKLQKREAQIGILQEELARSAEEGADAAEKSAEKIISLSQANKKYAAALEGLIKTLQESTESPHE